jgi:hypothetical protein
MSSSPRLTRELERARAELAALERRRAGFVEVEQRAASHSPLRAYWNDPDGFVRDAFTWGPGEGPAPYQSEIMRSLVEHHRVSARGPHGLGKTTENAWLILWFALTREGHDWKVITTASAWRQLTVYLWPEVHKWARRLRPDVIGRPLLRPDVELLDLAIKLKTGQATAVASNDPEKIEGAHADHILYVFDEAKIIPAATFDAAEGALSTGDAYAVAMSTPGEPSGRFYEIHRRATGYGDWWTRHVTKEEAIAAGRMDAEWCEKRRDQWGDVSAVYKNRVLGDFASSDENAVIPLAWVEAANERWLAWRELGGDDAPDCVGVDVAAGGQDESVLAPRRGWVITTLHSFAYADTMATTGEVATVIRKGARTAIVDVIGVGAGVADRLREQGHDVVAFNAGAATDATDSSGELTFVNKRSAAWWAMREYLDPTNDSRVALPPDEETGGRLTQDLTEPHWGYDSRGKILIESKKEIRKRIGRSTDYGDAVIQAFWSEPPAPTAEVVVYEDDDSDWMPGY